MRKFPDIIKLTKTEQI